MTDAAPWDPVFAHLLEVSREAAGKGNRGPAEILFRSCQAEAKLSTRREEALAHRLGELHDATLRAKEKAHTVAQLLEQAATLPSGPDDSSPFAVVKARRRQRDPLANLALEPAQAAAAGEIMAIFEAMTRGLGVTVRPLLSERIDGGGYEKTPFDAMPVRLARAHKERYLPWTARRKNAVAERRVGGMTTERLSGVGLVVAVLVDKVPLRTIEGLYRTRNGFLAAKFREALDDYWPKSAGPGRRR